MRRSSVGAVLLLILGCGTDDDTSSQAFVFQELADQGLTRYVGAASPIGSVDVNDSTVFEFDTTDGPICLHGAVYRAAVRHTGSSDLDIDLDIEFLEQILGSFDETNVRGVTVAEWVGKMVHGGDWDDLVEEQQE